MTDLDLEGLPALQGYAAKYSAVGVELRLLVERYEAAAYLRGRRDGREDLPEEGKLTPAQHDEIERLKKVIDGVETTQPGRMKILKPSDPATPWLVSCSCGTLLKVGPEDLHSYGYSHNGNWMRFRCACCGQWIDLDQEPPPSWKAWLQATCLL
jgi:hypothetical protein